MTRLLAVFFLALALVPLAAAQGSAQSAPPVDIVELRGPMDQRLIDFAVDAVTTSDAQLVILQIDSPGVSSGDLGALRALIADPPVPLAAYVGPRPARALGGAGVLALEAPLLVAAPGVEIGFLDPLVIRSGDSAPDGVNPALHTESVVIDEQGSGLADLVEPALVQVIIDLDQREFAVDGQTLILTTATTITDDGGTITVPAGETRFVRPGLWTRFLRLAATPEATFLFLMVGLAAAAFEFYAAGAGVTAAVAALALFPAGYGLATLPIRWWAVALALVGLVLYTADFQRVTLAWRSLLGTVLLFVGGMYFTDAAPQFTPKLWAVALTVIGVAAFYAIAMTTVVRSRFSTRTIGRDHLVGRRAVAETDFDQDGVVDVDGALWRARSTRSSGIGRGDEVEVVEVRGIVLEVDPV